MPVSVPPVLVAVMVFSVPASVTETFPVRTPEMKLPDTVGEMVPAFVVRSTVPVKEVTVLPLASLAVMVMLKSVPAICGEEMVSNAK